MIYCLIILLKAKFYIITHKCLLFCKNLFYNSLKWFNQDGYGFGQLSQVYLEEMVFSPQSTLQIQQYRCVQPVVLIRSFCISMLCIYICSKGFYSESVA